MKIINQLGLYLFQIAKILSFSIIFSACSTLGNTSTRIGQTSASYVSEFPEVNIGEISGVSIKDTFQIGDAADVSVYNVESLSNTYVVDRKGDIVFPLIGKVKVAGLSTYQLQEQLTSRYGEQYLREPGINVKIEAQSLGKIVVDGAVRKPGVFEIDGIIRLTEAIALAQGLNNEDTSGSKIYIVRTIDGKEVIAEVNLQNIRKFGLPDAQIIPNDVIFVQDSRGRIVFREFLKTLPLLNTIFLISRTN